MDRVGWPVGWAKASSQPFRAAWENSSTYVRACQMGAWPTESEQRLDIVRQGRLRDENGKGLDPSVAEWILLVSDPGIDIGI